jgi:hypothetical protein
MPGLSTHRFESFGNVGLGQVSHLASVSLCTISILGKLEFADVRVSKTALHGPLTASLSWKDNLFASFRYLIFAPETNLY